MSDIQSKIAFPLFFVLGVAICGFGIMKVLAIAEFKENAFKAEGIVVELQQRTGHGARYSYSPLVDYIDHKGLKQKYYSNSSSNPPHFHVGEKVVVLLDPNDPNYLYNAELDTFWHLYGTVFTLGCFGVAFLLFWVVGSITTKSSGRLNVKK